MIVVNSKSELKELINKRIEEQGPNCDLNDIDVSRITDMSQLFQYSEFNGDISSWNVSNVKTMTFMFKESSFNGDLSKWDVSKVTEMIGTFERTNFKRDLSNWRPIDVKDMSSIFYKSPLDHKEPWWYDKYRDSTRHDNRYARRF